MDSKIIKQSFALMQPHAERIVRRAFQLLEERHTKAYSLFQNTDMERQYSALTRTLAFVAYNIHNKERLVSYLTDLGTRHVGYGVSPSDFGILCTCLLAAMNECMGLNFSGEVEAQWKQTMTFVESTMQSGTTEEEEIEENAEDSADSREVNTPTIPEQSSESSTAVNQSSRSEEATDSSHLKEGLGKVIPLSKEQLENYDLPDEIKKAIEEKAKTAFQQAVNEAWAKALQEQEENFKKLKDQIPFKKEA